MADLFMFFSTLFFSLLSALGLIALLVMAIEAKKEDKIWEEWRLKTNCR